jgi:hypothetical protein
MCAKRNGCLVLFALLAGLAGLALAEKSRAAEAAEEAGPANAFGQIVNQLAHQEAGRGFGQEVSRMAHQLKDVLGTAGRHGHGRRGQHFTPAFFDTLALLEQLEEELEQLLALERALAHARHSRHHHHHLGQAEAGSQGNPGGGAPGKGGTLNPLGDQLAQGQTPSSAGRRAARAGRLREALPQLCCCLGENPLKINIDIFNNNTNTNTNTNAFLPQKAHNKQPQQPTNPTKPKTPSATGGTGKTPSSGQPPVLTPLKPSGRQGPAASKAFAGNSPHALNPQGTAGQNKNAAGPSAGPNHFGVRGKQPLSPQAHGKGAKSGGPAGSPHALNPQGTAGQKKNAAGPSAGPNHFGVRSKQPLSPQAHGKGAKSGGPAGSPHALGTRGPTAVKGGASGKGGKQGSNFSSLAQGKARKLSAPVASRVGQGLHQTLRQQVAWRAPHLGMAAPQQRGGPKHAGKGARGR